MKRIMPLALGVLVIGLGILAFTMLFTVHQAQQVIVMQFGNPIRVISEPGLTYKAPWQSLLYYDRRVLNLDPPVERVILADQKPLLVDAFARYRISRSARGACSARPPRAWQLAPHRASTSARLPSTGGRRARAARPA